MAIDCWLLDSRPDWDANSALIERERCEPRQQIPSQRTIDEWIESAECSWFPKESVSGDPDQPVLERLSVDAYPELEAEIKHAEQMVEEDEEYEDEPTYTGETLNRAISFLTAQLAQVKEFGCEFVPVPKIGPGPDLSVDIHWKQEKWELLVNISADSDELATFYGDDYGVQKIKGSVDPTAPNNGIILWLMKS
jgi:hypothetical protein